MRADQRDAEVKEMPVDRPWNDLRCPRLSETLTGSE